MSGYGSFVWYELRADGKEAAEKFYGHVLGWKFEAAGQPGIDYGFISVDGARIGGLSIRPKNACAEDRPGWLGYVGVEDADATASAFAEKGGRIYVAPQDIPGYGRFAVLADPQGAKICVIAPGKDMMETPSLVHRPGVPGFGGWHELYTDDPEAAFEFYSGLFGWTKDQAFDLGEFGTYQLFAIGGASAGGVMKRPPHVQAPGWNYYFNVESIDAATARIAKANGRLIHGPEQVPGGAWILNAIDDQGVVFSLVAPER